MGGADQAIRAGLAGASIWAGSAQERHVDSVGARSGGVYELDGTIPELLDQQMVDDPDTCLAQDLFSAWRAVHSKRASHGTCVGFKTPLFLGGDGTVENLEIVDEAVYWQIHGQLWAKVRGLPPGAVIDGVEIN